MWQRNKGQEDAEILQNRFTAYLVTAVNRRKATYVNQKNKQLQRERLMEIGDWNMELTAKQGEFDELPLIMNMENDRLFFALKHLNKKELYVFLERVLNEASFEGLAAVLGLTYKGTTTIYYRTIQKIKKYMEEINDGV